MLKTDFLFENDLHFYIYIAMSRIGQSTLQEHRNSKLYKHLFLAHVTARLSGRALLGVFQAVTDMPWLLPIGKFLVYIQTGREESGQS